ISGDSSNADVPPRSISKYGIVPISVFIQTSELAYTTKILRISTITKNTAKDYSISTIIYFIRYLAVIYVKEIHNEKMIWKAKIKMMRAIVIIVIAKANPSIDKVVIIVPQLTP